MAILFILKLLNKINKLVKLFHILLVVTTSTKSSSMMQIVQSRRLMNGKLISLEQCIKILQECCNRKADNQSSPYYHGLGHEISPCQLPRNTKRLLWQERQVMTLLCGYYKRRRWRDQGRDFKFVFMQQFYWSMQ